MNSKMYTNKELDYVVDKCARVVLHVLRESAESKPRATCLECIHFNNDGELCMIANQRPPARVIAFGCPAFVADEVPF